MIYAIISDVHANASALKRVISDARANGAEVFVSLGDVVGYGPLPAQCVKIVRETCACAVAGNHDDAVSRRGSDADFNDLAGEAARRHRSALSHDDIAWLRSLPYTCEFGDAVAVHGDLFAPQRFYYLDSEADAASTLAATAAQIVFVGHTHVPALFVVGASGKVYKTGPQDFTLERGKRYVVNPGSVGYPREEGGECMSSYVLYDSSEGTIVFRRLPFSVASVMQRGDSPAKRPGWRTLLAVCALGAVAAAIVATLWLVTPRGAIPGAGEPAAFEQAAEAPIAEASLNLSPQGRFKFTTPGLELARKPKSPPVRLTIVFFSADGDILSEEESTVKSSRMSFAHIPVAAANATKAQFTIRRVKPADEPRVIRFEPRALEKRQ